MNARAINAVLGSWLFASVFLWEHGPRQFHNGWICGAIIVTGALAGLSGAWWGRLLNAGMAVWIMLSALLWADPDRIATLVNRTVVGAFVALFAFLPAVRELGRGHPEDAPS